MAVTHFQRGANQLAAVAPRLRHTRSPLTQPYDAPNGFLETTGSERRVAFVRQVQQVVLETGA